MARLFGTDGVRGVANVELTPELAFKLGYAAAKYFGREVSCPKIIIGRDTRRSGQMLESALAAGICSAGGNAHLLGVMPTPAVSFLTSEVKANAGVVISASHNPFEDNGIKFFSQTGHKLPDAVEDEIAAIVAAPIDYTQAVSGSSVGQIIYEKDLSALYIKHILSTAYAKLNGLKIVMDCSNGANSEIAPVILRSLGAEVVAIFNEPNGININNGCGSTHLEQLSAMTVAGKYQLGIAFDGDADRCLLVDEQGHTIDGDKIMAVCGKALRQQGKLTNNAVVATVMSNLGLHEFCRNEQIELVCTAVGDRHVLEKMLECDYAIGGEQSGHMIFREYATTGDGELTALQFLKALKASGKSASELAGCCAQYPQELVNVALPHTPGEKERVMNAPGLWQAVREKEAELGGEGRILIRPSGTEALIRVMVEAKTDEIAREVAEDLAELVKKL